MNLYIWKHESLKGFYADGIIAAVSYCVEDARRVLRRDITLFHIQKREVLKQECGWTDQMVYNIAKGELDYWEHMIQGEPEVFSEPRAIFMEPTS